MTGPGPTLANVIELLVLAGVFTGITETIRWWLGGRSRARVDNAKIVQGMAIDLVAPLHTELDACRVSLADLRLELDAVLGYALIAHALLETAPVRKAVLDSGRSIPEPPPTMLRRP